MMSVALLYFSSLLLWLLYVREGGSYFFIPDLSLSLSSKISPRGFEELKNEKNPHEDRGREEDKIGK